MEIASMNVIELRHQRQALEKLFSTLSSKESTPDEETIKKNTEEVLKIFGKLIEITANADMIEKSKINEVLLNFKSSFPKDSDIGKENKKLLSKWRQDLRAEEEATASAVTTSSSVSDAKKSKNGTSANEKRRSKVTVDSDEGGEDADESVSKKRKPSGVETPMTPGAGDFGGVDKLPAGRKKVSCHF